MVDENVSINQCKVKCNFRATFNWYDCLVESYQEKIKFLYFGEWFC